ncbi:carboxypeptidase Y-like [Cucumis melo var. makuwa]|uniref:Carboxypeptidase Y-like n=1 Tax=Cucumis melo var. makuwa TaxID=1194695 RepID=A0A5D3CFR6_CUCMM|nr:carboxypeptidase Y-like [Cucumis melo var. makuwa]
MYLLFLSLLSIATMSHCHVLLHVDPQSDDGGPQMIILPPPLQKLPQSDVGGP